MIDLYLINIFINNNKENKNGVIHGQVEAGA